MNAIKEIVFLGASTAFLEVSEIINAINSIEKTYKVIAILDDNKDLHGHSMKGVEVVGPLSIAKEFVGSYFVFGIGSMKTRLIRHEIMHNLGIDVSRFVSIIHPSAIIDGSATIDHGCIIHPGVCIGNDVRVDPFSIIAVNSAIGPYAHIGAFAMVTSLVAILTGSEIGKAAFVGACSCVTENVNVGNGCMIGVGSVVSRNLDKGVFFLGNPGRVLNKVELPIELQ